MSNLSNLSNQSNQSSQTNFQKVGEFHDLFGHPQRTQPYVNMFEENPKLVNFRLSLIDEEVRELKEACEKHDLVEASDALADILYVVYGAGHAFGLDLDELFAEVHNSNLSKLCKSEGEAKETVEWYLQNEPRYKKPSYRKSSRGEFWVVYDAETSKILKSIKFRLPNLKAIMDSHL